MKSFDKEMYSQGTTNKGDAFACSGAVLGLGVLAWANHIVHCKVIYIETACNESLPSIRMLDKYMLTRANGRVGKRESENGPTSIDAEL